VQQERFLAEEVPAGGDAVLSAPGLDLPKVAVGDQLSDSEPEVVAGLLADGPGIRDQRRDERLDVVAAALAELLGQVRGQGSTP